MPARHLDAVLEAAVDAVILIDHRGRIRFANSAAGHLFGWNAHALAGMDIGTLVPLPDAGTTERDRGAGLASIAGTSRDIAARRRDGTRFPAHLSLGQVAGADPPEFLGLIHDLSGRTREAEEAQLRARRLMQVSRLATMGEMAAGLAHEINQPLTAIMNYARAGERFLDRPHGQCTDLREALEGIAWEAQRAGEIIRRLRRMVRTADDAPELAPLSDVLEELRPLCLMDAQVHDAHIHFEVQPMLPALRLHRLQIAQAVLNLVHNALEAFGTSPRADRQVVVAARRSVVGTCELSVEDNGPGVPADIVGQMFEPFRSTRQSGPGLGLPICSSIAQAHGGTLRHEPVQPHGARFILELPVAGRQ